MKLKYNEDYTLEVLLDRVNEDTYKLILGKHDSELGYSSNTFLLQNQHLVDFLEYIEARSAMLSDNTVN